MNSDLDSKLRESKASKAKSAGMLARKSQRKHENELITRAPISQFCSRFPRTAFRSIPARYGSLPPTRKPSEASHSDHPFARLATALDAQSATTRELQPKLFRRCRQSIFPIFSEIG